MAGNLQLAYNTVVNVCNNNMVLYSQRARTTVNEDNHSTYTYCDCSSLMSYGLTKGGYFSSNPWFSTSSEIRALQSIGWSQVPITGEWKPGDILWRSGHTEMVYSGGSGSGVTMGAKNSNVAAANQVCISSFTSKASSWSQLWRDTRGTVNGTSSTVNSSGSSIAITDTASAYVAAVQGGILPSKEEITPYLIVIDRNTDSLNYTRLKKMGVIGVVVEAGSYFDVSHRVYSNFRNPKLDKQIQEIKSALLPYGLFINMRARTVQEAFKEIYEVKLAVRKYPPSLGFWLKPEFTNSKKTNNDIVDTYYTHLLKLGLKDQIGFYCTKATLDKIDWKNYYDNWYWWMDRHINTIEHIRNLMTPKFFDYTDPNDDLSKYEMISAGNSVTSSSSGNSIPIDYRGKSNCYTYMGWQMITARTSKQYKLKSESGMHFNGEGFGVINGRYVIATTSTFGVIGDYIDFKLANGQVLRCIKGDEKSSGDSNWSSIGHVYGNSVSVIEFIVNKNTWYPHHVNPGTATCHPEWKGNLVSYTKQGNFWG